MVVNVNGVVVVYERFQQRRETRRRPLHSSSLRVRGVKNHVTVLPRNRSIDRGLP